MSVYDTPLTWLYAPAIRLELMQKALTTGSDAVIYDLEDAVVSDRKLEARRLLVEHLDTLPAGGHRPEILVRINAVQSGYGEDDIAAIAGHQMVDGVRIPKVESPEDVKRVAELLGAGTAPTLYPLLESALAVERAFDIARAHPAIGGLVIGEQDMRTELGLRSEDAFSWIRTRILVAARAADLPAPPMNVYTKIDDLEGLEASCRSGREMGFFGRSILHPRQILTVRNAFRPDEEEVEAAKKVVEGAREAARDGAGAFVLSDGRFVDGPIVESARRTLEMAKRLG